MRLTTGARNTLSKFQDHVEQLQAPDVQREFGGCGAPDLADNISPRCPVALSRA